MRKDERIPTEEDLKSRPPGRGWYLSRAGPWRRPVAAWMLDREGLHAAFALLLTAMLALFTRTWGIEIGVALYALLVTVFIVYEIVEDWRIHDGAYRDIMGLKQGGIPSVGLYAVAYNLLPWLQYTGGG